MNPEREMWKVQMSIQSGNEEFGSKPESMLTSQDSGSESASWRQDDAPTASELEIGGKAVAEAPPPARDIETVLETLASTPGEFGRIIEGESRERLAQPASDGDWGIVEILPHVGDWEEVNAFWTRRILEEESPELEAVDDSLWAIEHDYANEDPFRAFERFAELRHGLIDVLRELDDEDWQRTAIHATGGRMTLHQFVDRICDHDARQLAQARDALA